MANQRRRRPPSEPGSREPGRFDPRRFGSWIDQTLEEARRKGAFDELEGSGKPLENLDSAQDPLWWAKEMVRREGIEVLPPALEVRRKVEKLREAMPQIEHEADLVAAIEALNAEIRELNTYAHKGPPTTQPMLDLPTERARWQSSREDETGSD